MFTIDDIIRTLNEIEVKGKENMDRLLGAIMALEFMKEAQKNEETIEVEEEPKEEGE
jgi:hypothetical protein